MLTILESLLTTAGPAAKWLAITAAAVVGAFAIYAGVAVFVGLFSKDKERRKDAVDILKLLLALFRRGRTG